MSRTDFEPYAARLREEISRLLPGERLRAEFAPKRGTKAFCVVECQQTDDLPSFSIWAKDGPIKSLVMTLYKINERYV